MSEIQTPDHRIEVPSMIGPRVRLRAPRFADVDARLALGREPEILRAYGRDPARLPAIDAAGAAAWVREQRAAMAWMITVDGQLIGSTRLHSHDVADRRAQVAIGLLDASRLGQGYGTEALRLVIGHAFDGMGLHRLSLRVLAGNARAIACYERLGFVHEGRERQSARTDDGWRDDLIMGLLADEWAAG